MEETHLTSLKNNSGEREDNNAKIGILIFYVQLGGYPFDQYKSCTHDI